MESDPKYARKMAWVDPVRGRPASPSTLNVVGDFERFTDIMRNVVLLKREPKHPTPASASPDPVAS